MSHGFIWPTIRCVYLSGKGLSLKQLSNEVSSEVSVVIPAYNIRSYLMPALLSLQQQTLSSFEALIVDDGSTDGTAEVAIAFAKGDQRFRVLRKKNGGLSSARNHGIRHARSNYIALLDGDDLYSPDKLARHVAVLRQKPEVGVVYSASQAIRDDGRPTPIRLSGRPIYADPLIALLCKNFIGHGSNAVFRKRIFEEVGEFDESLRSCEDIDFWLRIAAVWHWQFYRDPQVLCKYRVRPSGLSFNVKQMHFCQMQVLESARQRSPETVEPMLPTARAYAYRLLARLSLSAGDRDQAEHYIGQAWAEDATIFYRDPRSLITLVSVKLMPVANVIIGRLLGRASSVHK